LNGEGGASRRHRGGGEWRPTREATAERDSKGDKASERCRGKNTKLRSKREKESRAKGGGGVRVSLQGKMPRPPLVIQRRDVRKKVKNVKGLPALYLNQHVGGGVGKKLKREKTNLKTKKNDNARTLNLWGADQGEGIRG